MNETTTAQHPPIPKLEGVEHWSPDVWLSRHYDRHWLSASRVADALGYGDYSSPLQAYSELRGDIHRPDTTLPMELGHMLEPTVDELYKRETGRPTMNPGDYAVIRHPDIPWLFSTLDRVTMNDAGERGPLELKTTGSYKLADWKDGSPIGPQIQHQVQMECSGLSWGSLAVLVGNTSFFYHDYLHDPVFAEELLKALDKFHTDVVDGNAPDPTWQDGDAIKALHPKDNGKTLWNPDLSSMLQDFAKAKTRYEDAETNLLSEKNRLIAKIGDNTYIQAGDLRYSYKHQKRRTKASVEEKREHQLVAAGIMFNPAKESEFRVLRKEKIK